jgi:hypothetical protein
MDVVAIPGLPGRFGLANEMGILGLGNLLDVPLMSPILGSFSVPTRLAIIFPPGIPKLIPDCDFSLIFLMVSNGKYEIFIYYD